MVDVSFAESITVMVQLQVFGIIEREREREEERDGEKESIGCFIPTVYLSGKDVTNPKY